MPTPLAKIKGHVESKWLAEVYADGSWNGYDAWSTRYEPKKETKEDSKFKKQAKAKVAEKAKETILSTLETGISKKLLLVILEIVSKILNQLETNLEAAGRLPQQLVNNCSAIVLSYRFEKSKKQNSQKIAYLRATAIDLLTTTLQEAGDQLPNVQTELRSSLASLANVRALISDQLDDLIVVANDKMDQLGESVEETIERSRADAALQAAGIQRPEFPKERARAKKDELVDTISLAVKDGILSKLDNLHLLTSAMIDELLVGFTLASAQQLQNNAKEKGELNQAVTDSC